MEIDLLSSASFVDGRPVERYRWLRDNAPGHGHREPAFVQTTILVARLEDSRPAGEPTWFASNVVSCPTSALVTCPSVRSYSVR